MITSSLFYETRRPIGKENRQRKMVSWADENKRQQQDMQAIYEVDQEQEADERGK
jgi:hypothetical protein